MEWEDIHKFIDEMVSEQRESLLKMGRSIVPRLTPEDILQPNDFPDLEESPVFRYEEGILAGLQSLQIALKSLEKSDR